jgi:hypothetical protein
MGGKCCRAETQRIKAKSLGKKESFRDNTSMRHERTLKYKKIKSLFAKNPAMTLRTQLFCFFEEIGEECSTPRWGSS